MYLNSDQPTPLLTQQIADQQRKAALSDARIRGAAIAAARGRAALFNTLISPNTVNCEMGMGTALDVATLQQQSEVARATALLAPGLQAGQSASGSNTQPSVQEIIAGAPEVVSNHPTGSCVDRRRSRPASEPTPTPGMPESAPTVVNSRYGPMHYRGRRSTVAGQVPASNNGLSGYAPAWGDAWVLPEVLPPGGAVSSWIVDHPWLSLAIAGLGVFAISRGGKR